MTEVWELHISVNLTLSWPNFSMHFTVVQKNDYIKPESSETIYEIAPYGKRNPPT